MRMAIDVAKRCWVSALAIVLSLSGISAGERWSRQLTDYGNVQGSDWIPLSRPGDRQAGAKVLNYFDNTGFLGNDNNAQPQHHQFSYVNQPFGAQASRVVFPPTPVAQPLQQELDTAFNQPFGSHQSFIQHSPFGGVQTIQRHPLPAFNPQLPKENLVQDKPSLVEHQYQFPSQVQPQTTHLRQPPTPVHQGQPANGVSQEEVQLLYVPVETLYNQKQAAENTRFNSLPQPVSASLINDFYTAATTTAKPRTTNTPFTTKVAPSVALPSKPKPNQPPLAMFMYNDDKQIKLTVSDALSNLKNVNNIAVLDSLSKNLPKVFIGPSGLAPPKGYSKFELPYLSSIDQNRLSAKPGDLPFFVAPQSYKTPGGFSKIPLPAPHVGSVIVQQPLIQANYFRQPENIEYYQPSTLKFTDVTTKSPITLPNSKPQYESDHYTSPTSKPTTDRTNYSRGNTQTPQESYRQPQTERALFSHSPFNSVNTNRHIVNEEYFNLAKTKKPTTPSPTQSYSPKTYKPFDFKPIPEQKIPLYPEINDYTTQKTTTTTERPHTSRQEESRMKSFFKEENFRNRRPYVQPTLSTPYEEQEVTQPVRASHDNEGQFIHKFKLVDSVRPQTTPATKSVIDNAFLDFFQQDNRDTLKAGVSNNQPPNGAQQVIRNNYFSQNSNDEPPKQKFVSTYYAPTTTSTTLGTTTPAGSTTAQDSFFKEFEEKSKQYEPEVSRFPPSRLQNQDSFLNRFTETTYTNKYKYDTNTDDAHYPVEVVTTQEPLRQETSNDVTIPPSEQSYSIPSELPPISANLPGLVNSLMEDEWPHKKGDQDSSPPATTKGHFRKQNHRTTELTTTLEPYISEVTTRRIRGRRPTTASSSNYDSATPTRATTVNRSRSRYVAADGERSSGRTRTRSRPQSSSSRISKEENNLEYQRDVLKQNYPVIRPTSEIVTTTTTTPAPPPPPTTSTTTTYATTMPVTNQQIYDEQTERFNPYYSSEPQSYSEVPAKYEEVSIPKKDSYTENYFEPDVTTTLPHTTYKQQYSPEPTTEEIDDESVRVLPVDHPVEAKREQPVEIQREKPATAIHAQLPRRQPARQPVYQLPEEQHPPVTPSYNSHEDEMEIRKVEITPRPRRPLSRQPVYSPRTTAHTERPTTERTTTEQPPSPSSSRGTSVQRRPAFVRRPARPLYTTTLAPTTTYSSRSVSTGDDEQSTQGSYTVRPKSRQDILRGRTRRPVTSTVATTTTASPEPPVTRGFARNKDLRRVSPTSRSRQELRERERDQREQPAETTTTQPPRFRIRERTRFNLQPQESQWSTKLTQNSFQPVQDVESRSKNYEGERTATEPETEIVTASALQQHQEDVQLISVSANMGGTPTAPVEQDQRKDKSGNDVLLKEVELSQEPPQAEENGDNSNAPSFAELLDDVMKEYIDTNLQQGGEPERKPVENEVLIEESKPVTSEPNRGSNERKPYNTRANFRKRGRSHVVDAFEAAESQHINSHVYNTAGFESLKTIDKAALQGKNVVNEAKGSKTVEEVATTTTTTTTEAPVTELPETTTFGGQDTTPLYETTSVLPTEREVTTAVPTLEAQSENDEHQFSTEQFYDDEQDQIDDEQEDHQQGIFDDVKKQLSDLFAMAENDPETEEIEDEEEHYRPVGMGSFHDVEQGSTENPITSTTISTDVVASENRQEPVTEVAAKGANDDAMGPMAIPTSTSNGITHETEICYRGRCIKTDQKKPKKSKFKPN